MKGSKMISNYFSRVQVVANQNSSFFALKFSAHNCHYWLGDYDY